MWCKRYNANSKQSRMDLKLAEVYKENWPVSEPYRQQFATDSTRCLQIYLTDVRRYFLETKNCCWHLQLRDIQTEKGYVFSLPLLLYFLSGFVLWENRSPGGRLSLKKNLSMELLLVEMWISCHSLNKQRPITVLSTPTLRI